MAARILVVDDHEAGRYAKSRLLRAAGYHVVETATGHAALERVTVVPPDLVLLDVRLPDIDGFAVCRQIKTAVPQVTILQTSSARADATDRAAALDIGADSYLVEPIEPAELLAVVRALLRMRAAEQEVRRLNEDLEARAAARALELEEANRQLDAERRERRKTEDVLWHIQKLEAFGQLSGGVAHDFNNLLTVIIGNLELAREALTDSRRLPKEHVANQLLAALSAAEHGADITQRMLAFARQSLLRVEAVHLDALIAGSMDLLRQAVGEAITCELTPAASLWPCVIDPIQFEAAMLNLAVNARDAMPDGGRLRIELKNISAGANRADRPAEMKPGRYVSIAVSDTGVGMERAILERIFEPFFTTKEPGRGVGLGLSQVYGFVKQSDGHIAVESIQGTGSTFRLFFPYSSAVPETASVSDPVRVAGSEGREKILVVEDNEQVRDVVVELIKDLGYDVVVAGDGNEALKALRTDTAIRLVFTDIVMPHGNGVALAKAVAALDKKVKVVLTSGYPARTLPTNLPLVSKPYRREVLARVLRETLDGESESLPKVGSAAGLAHGSENSG
jgi:signal transduction histidine kinase